MAGATDFEVAEELGVTNRTLYRWKAKYPEFCQALKVGKELADDRVEASLYHRAIGYTHHTVKVFQFQGAPVIVPVLEHVPPDVGAATMWLTNRRSAEWRAKQTHEHGGLNGAPIRLSNVDELSDENLESIVRAALAGSGSSAPPEPEKGAG